MVQESTFCYRCTSKVYHHYKHLDDNAPENNMEAERRQFPAGLCLTYGWLSHSNIYEQWPQHCLTERKVPTIRIAILVCFHATILAACKQGQQVLLLFASF